MRLPTDFETMVLRRIAQPAWHRILAGNGQVAISAACRRLEKLGYAAKPGSLWHITDKGQAWLTSADTADNHCAVLVKE